MKKINLLMVLVSFLVNCSHLKSEQNTIDASAAVSDFCKEEYSNNELDERLGVSIINLCKTVKFKEEFIRLLRLSFKEDEIIRLIEIFDLMIQVNEKAADSAFAEQLKHYVEIVQSMHQEDITEEKLKELNDIISKECPLVQPWINLCGDLKSFQDGLSKGITALRLDHILAGVVKEIKKR